MRVNAVLRRELLERWRGRRTVLVLTIYLLVLAGLLLLLHLIGVRYLANQARWGWGPAPMAAGPMLGRFLLDNLLALVLGLVLLVAPAYAAGQLAGERERRTLGLLRLTLIGRTGIVLGKLSASVAWVLLLVIAAAPLAAAAFVMGGTTVGDLIRGLLLAIVVAIGVAGIALGISARSRRTTGAIVTTYAIVLALVIGTLIGAFAEFALRGFEMPGGSRPMALYLNPFYGLADAAAAGREVFMMGGLPSVLSPFAAALPTAAGGIAEPAVGVLEVGVDGPLLGPRRPLVWPVTAGLYLLMGALGVLFARARVESTGRRRRRGEASP